MSMKWIGNRISFVDSKEKTTIIIYPEKKPLVTALMGAWIFMWYSIGITMVFAYFMMKLSQQEKLIVVIFMAFWLYYAIRVTRSFLWILWGTENIKIDPFSFTIKNATKKAGRAKSYYLENIKKFRMELPKAKSLQVSWESSPWVRGGERIEFDYMGKVIRLGQKLSEKDATLLFNLITKKVEEQIKLKSKKEKQS